MFANQDDSTHLISSSASTSPNQEQRSTAKIKPEPFEISESQDGPNFESEKSFYGNSIDIEKPRRLGQSYAFLYCNEKPLIIFGPDIKYVLFLFSFVLFLYFLEFFTVFKENFKVMVTIHTFVFFVQITSYSYTVLVNPGIPWKDSQLTRKRKEVKDISEYRLCKKCNLLVRKVDCVCHCLTCGVCVIKHDHHCSWCGKCIGKNNYWSFWIFISSTFSFFITSFLTFLFYVIKLAEKYENNK